jgi:hypothetical protein
VACKEGEDDRAEESSLEDCYSAYFDREVIQTNTSSRWSQRSCGLGHELHEHNRIGGFIGESREANESNGYHRTMALGRERKKVEAWEEKLEWMVEQKCQR